MKLPHAERITVFKEYESITLTAHIPPDRIWHVRKDSPLREKDSSVGCLQPGDAGLIIDMPAGYDSFLVEFTEPGDARPVAFVAVYPNEARHEMEGDRDRYRFWKNAVPTQVDEAVVQ